MTVGGSSNACILKLDVNTCAYSIAVPQSGTNVSNTKGMAFACAPQALCTPACTAPAAPTASASPTSINSGGSSTLSGSCTTGTLTWYSDAAMASTLSSTTVSPTATTTYYAACVNGTCKSTATPVTVTVNTCTAPSAPTASASPTSIGSGGSSTLSGSCAAGTLTWYSDAAMTSTLSSTTISPTATTTYYAACVNGTCKSTATPVTVTVNSGQSSTCAATDTYYILSDELTKTTHIINFATNTEVSSTSCLGTATGGEGVAVDATNNFVYIASNSFIQKYNVVTGVVVSTYTPTNVTVNAIHQIALSPNKQFLYVSLTRGDASYNPDGGNVLVYSTTTNSLVATIDLKATTGLSEGWGVAVDPTTGIIYASALDYLGSSKIVAINPSTYAITSTIYSTTSKNISGLTFDSSNNLWVVDRGLNFTNTSTVMKMSLTGSILKSCPVNFTTVATAHPSSPYPGMFSYLGAFGPDGNFYMTVGGSSNACILKLDVNTCAYSIAVPQSGTNVSNTKGMAFACAPQALCTPACTAPAAPTASASPTSINSGGSSTLSGSCATGTLTWYSDAAMASTLSSTTVSPTATTTYYAACVNGTCKSTATPVTVTVNTCTAPAAPTASASPTSISSGGSSTLSGSCAAGALTWYSDAAMASTLASTTVSPTATTTYYAACVNGTCKSTATPVTVTVNTCTTPTVGIPIATQATCNAAGTAANNDASISIGNISNALSYAYTTDGTTPAFAAATALSGTTLNLTALANPAAATTYKFRFFNGSATCFSDVQVVLSPKTCTPTCVNPTVGTPVATQATCNVAGTATNNDGKITINGISNAISYAYTTDGSTPAFTSATSFTGSAVFLINLANPTIATTYKFRFFNGSATCFTDVQTILNPTTCTVTCTTPNVGTIIVNQSTCTVAGTSANDANLTLSGISNATLYSYTTDGSTPSFAGATAVSGTSVVLSNIANPATAIIYNFRFFNGSATCFKDVQAVLQPKICVPACVPPTMSTPVATQATCPPFGNVSNDDAYINIANISAGATVGSFTNDGSDPAWATGFNFTDNYMTIGPLPNPTSPQLWRIKVYKDQTCFTEVQVTLQPRTCVEVCVPPVVSGQIVVTQATCNASGVSNDNGMIYMDGISGARSYAYSSGSATPSFASATLMNSSSIQITGLPNPSSSTLYTVRFYYNPSGTCYTDKVVVLQPKVCCAPPTAVGQGTSTCSGNTATLTVSGCNTTYPAVWYSNAALTTQIATGNSYTTPALSTTTSYYVACVRDASCKSTGVTVTATVTLQPTSGTPVVTQSTCNAAGTAANNDAGISITGITNATVYAYTTNGSTPTFAGATAVSGGAINLTALANPAAATTYKFRLFNGSATCFKDVTATLNPKTCTPTCTSPVAGTPAVTQATCNAAGTAANNDAGISITGIANATVYAYTTDGSTPAFAGATAVSGGAINLTGIANPAAATTYTIRLFNGSATCFTDVTATLNPKTCTPTCTAPTAGTPVVTQATCNAAGTAANNDAGISITGITNATVYAYTTDGSTPTFAGATAVSGGAINLTALANPAAATTYTIRLFNGSATCFTDVTATLNPKTCTPTCTAPTAGTPVVTQATCNAAGTAANNDAGISITGIANATVFAYTTDGSTPTFAGATAVSGGAINLTGIANPAAATTYSIRLFNGSATCFTDVTATLNPKTCTPTCTAPTAGTPTVTQATCNAAGTAANNDAGISITGIANATVYAYTTDGSTPTFAGATAVSGGAINLTGIANPAAATTYSIRLFNGSATCFTDVTATLNPKTCTPTCTAPTAGTPTVTQATCNAAGTAANNDASIAIAGITNATVFAYTTDGSTPAFAGATAVSGGAINLTALANPASATTYTIRLFNGSATCFTDVTATLNPKTCTPTCTAPTAGTPVVTQATCNAAGTAANNDASISITGITNATVYAYTTNGSTPAFAGATAVSGGAINLTGIANPASATTYTIRLFNGSATCFTDVTATLNPKTCTPVCVKPNAGSDITLTCPTTGIAPTTVTLAPVTTSGAWVAQTGNPAVTTVTGNNVTGLTLAGTYKFIYSVTGGGQTCTDTVQVIVPTCIQPKGSLGDFVWKDANNNGIQDETTPNAGGLAGVQIELYKNGVYFAKDTTDATGHYLFINLDAGTYKIKVLSASIPAGCEISSRKDMGIDDAKDSDVDKTTGFSGDYVIDPLDPTKKDILTVDAALAVPCVKSKVTLTGTPICSADNQTYSITFSIANKAGILKVNKGTLTGSNPYTVTGIPSGATIKITDSLSAVCKFDTLLSGPNCNCNPPVPNLLIPSLTACIGDTFPTLKATVVGLATVEWFATSTGTTVLFTGLNYKPSGTVPVGGTAFYAQARSTDPSCPTAISTGRVMATINAQDCTKEVDLALKKSINTKIAQIGDVLTYTLKVWNKSTTNASGVEVTDSIATTVQFQTGSFTASRGSAMISGNVIKWTIGNIAAAGVPANGDTVTLTYHVKAIQEGVHFNTAEISKVNEKDVDSTDDTDRLCFTVPVKLCAGEKVEINVPAKYTNVQWFKNGNSTPIGTSNTLLLSEVGLYTFTATNQTCPANGCCPIIIESGVNCCPEDLCIPFTIKKRKK